MSDLQAEFYEDFESLEDWEDLEEDAINAFEAGHTSEANDLAEVVLQFIESTPELTASEQAELLGAFVEDTWRSGEVDWGRISRGIQTGLSLFQTGAQIAGGLASFGGNSRTARDISRWSRRLGQGAGFAQSLFGNMPTGQPRRSPAPRRRTAPPGPRYRRPPSTPSRSRGGGSRGQGTRWARSRQPMNNTAQLAGLLNNPQIQQLLRSSLFRRREGVVRIESDGPYSESVSIPMADVVNTISRLARASAVELHALDDEDAPEIPEYLVGEDGDYIIDPECPEAREALVLEYLRDQSEADRYAELSGWDDMAGGGGYDTDAPEEWAREAGFDG